MIVIHWPLRFDKMFKNVASINKIPKFIQLLG